MTDRTADAATVDIIGATTAEGAVTETALPLPAPLGGEDRGTPRHGQGPPVRHYRRGADHPGNAIATSE
ncbi:hypothetical protein ACW9HJ_23185 [Nocardia gipuzkoensis]